MKKEAIMGILIATLLIPLVSAGIIDWFKDVMLSPSEDQEISVNVQNAVPIVNVISGSTPAIVEDSSADTTIIFQVSDANGQSEVDMSGAPEAIAITLTSPSLETRTGTEADCSQTATPVTNGYEYTCDITMWFYDEEGTWDIDVSVTDSGSATGTADDSGEDPDDLNVNQLKAIKLLRSILGTAGTIEFGSVAPGATNIQSTAGTEADDTQVVNIGNFDIDDAAPSTDLTITAAALTNGVDSIPVGNFRSADENDFAEVCSGPGGITHTGSAVTLTNFDLAKATTSPSDATRDIRHCITLVPTAISSGTYNTGGSGWTFAI